MKNWKTIILVAAAAGMTAACGDFYELKDTTVPEVTLTAGRDSIDLMVGDRFDVPIVLTPDTLAGLTLYWESADTTVAALDGATVVAKAPGRTTVQAYTSMGERQVACAVRVYPQWTLNPYKFLYDMVVFANVTVGGRPADSETTIAVFGTDDDGNEELRGLGSLQQEGARQYMLLRVYSNVNYSDEPMTLRCYDRTRALVTTASDTIDFDNNSTLGTLSQLYSITFE